MLLAATFVAYLPVWQAGFVWDDQAHVTAPSLRSLHGLWLIWTDVHATQQYYPLLHSFFWIEHQLWGDTTLGYHLANVSLHTLAACLFAVLLRRLGIPGAWFAALVFAVHPVHVESVAWITEQKNTLSTVFYLAAAIAYVRYTTDRRRANYSIATGLFVLALLSKTVTATLPAALLVLCWWRHGGISWRSDVLPLLPWFALGAGAGLGTAFIEHTIIGAGAAYELSFAERLVLAGRVVWFYPGKLLWPAELVFFYPRWTINAGSVAQWLPLVGAVLLSLLLWLARRRSRAPFAAWLLFVGALFPVLGFFNVYPFQYSFVADHFQYLASLPLFALLAAAGATFVADRSAAIRGGAAAVVLLLVAGLGILTWRQSHIYRDAETLLRATIARNPTAWNAHNDLGEILVRDPARQSEALACFQRALELKPDYYAAHNNLGLALSQNGRPAEAIPHLEEALRLKPGVFQTYNNLGIALAKGGRYADAVAAFAEAARLNPLLPNIEENWAKALLLLGHEAEAAEHFERAARLREARPNP